MRLKRTLVALTLVGAIFAVLANNAFASSPLHPVRTGGLPTNNVGRAVSMIKDQASYDPAFAATLAHNAGAANYVAGQYRPYGYSMGAPHTVNTGSDTSGNIQNSRDTKECNSKTSTMVVMINIVTQIKVYVCTACSNPRVYSSRPAPKRVWAPFSKGTFVKYHKTKSQKMSITCPSGQKVTATVTATINGVLHTKVYGKVSGILDARLKAAFNGQLKVQTTLKCGPAPKLPPPPPPTGSCNANNSPGAIVCSSFYVIVTCGGAQITINGATQQEAIQNANQYVAQNCNTSTPPCNCTPPPPVCPPGTTGTPPNCVTPPVTPSVTITSTTTLNDIPEGKDSGPFYINVNASAAGTITIDPGVGGVSDCNSSTPQVSIPLPFGAGNSTLCVKLYAPMDANANSMTISETAIVTTSGGTAKDVKSQTFAISHPVRP